MEVGDDGDGLVGVVVEVGIDTRENGECRPFLVLDDHGELEGSLAGVVAHKDKAGGRVDVVKVVVAIAGDGNEERLVGLPRLMDQRLFVLDRPVPAIVQVEVQVRAALTELMNPAALFSVLIGALTPSLVHIASRPRHTALHMLQRAWAR